MAESRIVQTKQERRRRSGMGLERSLKLYVPESYKAQYPNDTFRFINDTPGRIESKTVEDDWNICEEEKNGEKVQYRRPVGPGPDGKPIYAYLCRKSKDLYDQDEAEKAKAILEQENSMKVAPLPSPQGLAAESKTAYVPGGRNTITKS